MDYNIYIHDKTNGSQKPTQPRKTGGVNTTPKSEKASGSTETSVAEEVATLKNIKDGVKGIGTAGQLGIALMVIKKAAELVVSTVDTIEPFVTRETGDYRFNTWWNNSKAIWGVITNPAGAALNYLTTRQNIRLSNKRTEQERLLIGDAEVNAWERRL